MRRTMIVLVISAVLLWGSAALARRPPTTRWDGDPDEYQSKAVHDERSLNTWKPCRYTGTQTRTSRTASEPGVSREPKPRGIGRLLWEILFLGKTQRYSGEG